ncbi:hypothetical protein Mapa_004564 [Marchantia paleacea]|nr:hypothetical protein Mapa_004564 [Marchantia paleacea]
MLGFGRSYFHALAVEPLFTAIACHPVSHSFPNAPGSTDFAEGAVTVVFFVRCEVHGVEEIQSERVPAFSLPLCPEAGRGPLSLPLPLGRCRAAGLGHVWNCWAGRLRH